VRGTRSAFILLVVGACGAPREPDASVSAAAQRLAAVERCAAAFEELAKTSAAPVSVLAACAGMRTRPACRSSLAAADDFDAAVAAMLGPCRDAYCPDLAAPRPAACAGPVGDRMAAAAELDTAILALEYGVGRDDVARVSLFRTVTHTRDGAVDRSHWPTVSATIGLRVEGQGVAVTVGDRRWSLPAAPAPADLAPIVAALPPPSADGQVVLEADEHMTHATVIALMRALKDAGYVRLAIATKASR
jgi:hypothetical protein